MNTNEILNLIMIGVGAILIYLAIKKDMEPTLLLPMGFGAILVNRHTLPGWDSDSLRATNQTDIRVVAEGLLKGESPIERFGVAVIPTPPWNFEDGLPVGTPAAELIQEGV